MEDSPTYYEGLIEEAISKYGEEVWDYKTLPDVYTSYCEQVAQSQQLPKESKEFLLACGYITEKMISSARQAGVLCSNSQAFGAEVVASMGLWRRGVAINLTQQMNDLYNAIHKWWKRVCTALRLRVTNDLRKLSGIAIVFMMDLSLAQPVLSE